MFTEDELLPISALQHLIFCERQWALIHLEGIWEENRLTAEGRHMHERTDMATTEVRGNIRIARGLRIQSLQLGLVGRADVVEFHRLPATKGIVKKNAEGGARLHGVAGLWQPYPVEYKRGRPKPDQSDAVQLCAQAFCLEEMLNVTIPDGALFYGRTRRRQDIRFDETLRRQTEATAARLHELNRDGRTPSARYEKKCDACSLFDLCLPKAIGSKQSVRNYLNSAFEM